MFKIGIVIPFFSNTNYLHELLNSLIAQSCSDWRAYIIDDSGENLLGAPFRNHFDDDRIVFGAHEINRGSVQTWNEGLEMVWQSQQFSVVSVVHADDRLGSNYVHNVLRAFEDHPDMDVFHVGAGIINAKGKPSWSIADTYKSIFRDRFFNHNPRISTGDEGLAQILKRNFIYCPALVFNCTRFEAISFDEHWQMVSDLDLVSKLILDGRSVLSLPDVDYFYRRHENNLSSMLTSSKRRFAEEIRLYDQLRPVCISEGFQESAREAKKKTSIKLHLLYRIIGQAMQLKFHESFVLIRLLKTCW